MKLFGLLFSAALARVTGGGAENDKITSLPGLDKLPKFDMYSGKSRLKG